MKRLLSFVLAALLTTAVLIVPASAEEQELEMRGVWVSSVYNLDYPLAPTADPAVLKAEADAILDNCKEMGMTAVFLQVRPCSDAFYPSKLYPWSVYLTGDQDTAPKDNFDPLAYWIDGAHERGMELHAWLNPYRVTKKGEEDLEALSEKSPAKLHPEWVVEHNKNFYLNPGIPEVQQYILAGIEEILQNYNVDGIHLDDYFYPGAEFDDAETFAQYGVGYEDVGDWRRDNVNNLIKSIKASTDRRSNVSFGVSPFGIWANDSKMPGGSATNGNQSYFSQYADSKQWVEEEWVDYICPQVYWNIGYTAADYEILVNWWADVVKGTDVKLYIGMSDYKAGNTSETSPWHGIEELKKQTALNRNTPEVDGELHFRYQFLLSIPGVKEFYTELHAGKAPEKEEPEVDENVLTRYPAPDQSGEWVQYKNETWSFFVDDAPVTGWRKIDSAWYYFGENNLMQTGWLLDTDGKWYYLRTFGAMKTGWLEDWDGSWYFLGGDGAMKSGWVSWKGDWYYMSGSGQMVTSRWIEYRGDWYYIKADGVMAVSTTIDGYKINADGVWVR